MLDFVNHQLSGTSEPSIHHSSEKLSRGSVRVLQGTIAAAFRAKISSTSENFGRNIRTVQTTALRSDHILSVNARPRDRNSKKRKKKRFEWVTVCDGDTRYTCTTLVSSRRGLFLTFDAREECDITCYTTSSSFILSFMQLISGRSRA